MMTAKQIRTAVCVGLLCLLIQTAQADDSHLGQEKPALPAAGVIVAMGDSLTEGLGVPETSAYPALLEKRLNSEGFGYRVVNAGVSGETSSGARSRMKWVMGLEPDILILETGANDGFRGIDTDLIMENIRAIVTFFQDRGVLVVLAGMRMVTNLGEDYTRRFAEIYPAVSAETGALLVPFLLEGVAARPELNQSDGIHPTAEGYQVVADTLYPYVLEAIRSLPLEKRHTAARRRGDVFSSPSGTDDAFQQPLRGSCSAS